MTDIPQRLRHVIDTRVAPFDIDALLSYVDFSQHSLVVNAGGKFALCTQVCSTTRT